MKKITITILITMLLLNIVLYKLIQRERLQDTKDFIHSLTPAQSCEMPKPICSI